MKRKRIDFDKDINIKYFKKNIKEGNKSLRNVINTQYTLIKNEEDNIYYYKEQIKKYEEYIPILRNFIKKKEKYIENLKYYHDNYKDDNDIIYNPDSIELENNVKR